MVPALCNGIRARDTRCYSIACSLRLGVRNATHILLPTNAWYHQQKLNKEGQTMHTYGAYSNNVSFIYLWWFQDTLCTIKQLLKILCPFIRVEQWTPHWSQLHIADHRLWRNKRIAVYVMHCLLTGEYASSKLRIKRAWKRCTLWQRILEGLRL